MARVAKADDCAIYEHFAASRHKMPASRPGPLAICCRAGAQAAKERPTAARQAAPQSRRQRNGREYVYLGFDVVERHRRCTKISALAAARRISTRASYSLRI